MPRWLKITLGVLGAFILLLFVNAFFVARQTKPANASAAGQIVDAPGGAIHVSETGKGPPIVLLHGWACAVNWFDRITPALSKGHRVVRIDLLGHGDSAKPRDGYSMEQQADRVAAVLERLGVRRAMIAGHSTGGEIAIALAGRHPELTRNLVVIDAEPNEDYVTVDDPLAKLSLKPVIGPGLWRITPDSAVRDGLKMAFANDSVPVPQQFIDDFRKMTFSSYKKTADESADYVDDHDLLKDITATAKAKPVLIIFGAEDRLIKPDESIASYRRQVPSAQTQLVAGAGHSPHWEKPAQTAALMLRFDRGATKN